MASIGAIWHFWETLEDTSRPLGEFGNLRYIWKYLAGFGEITKLFAFHPCVALRWIVPVFVRSNFAAVFAHLRFGDLSVSIRKLRPDIFRLVVVGPKASRVPRNGEK